MHGENLSSRVRVSSTFFLTIVAYQFSVSGSLPKVAYMTLLDRVMIASFVVIALTVVQSMVVAGRLEEKTDEEGEEQRKKAKLQRAIRIDRRARVLFPLAYGTVILCIALGYRA